MKEPETADELIARRREITQAQTLAIETIIRSSETMRQHEKIVNEMRKKRDAEIIKAARMGISWAELQTASRLSAPQIGRIVKKGRQ